jgi:hypothetical protein
VRSRLPALDFGEGHLPDRPDIRSHDACTLDCARGRSCDAPLHDLRHDAAYLLPLAPIIRSAS